MEDSSIRKLHIDSRFKEPVSNSTSDFVFELNRALTLPRKVAAFVTDVHLMHSWYNVDTTHKYLYLLEKHGNNEADTRIAKIELPTQNYTGTSLASQIQDELDAVRSVPSFAYTASYDANTGEIIISLASINYDFAGNWTRTDTGAPVVFTPTVSGYTLTVGGNSWGPVTQDRKTLTRVSNGAVGIWNGTGIVFSSLNVTFVPNNSQTTPVIATDSTARFRIYTDNELAQKNIHDTFTTANVFNNHTPIPYDQFSPKSINHILAHAGTSQEYNNASNLGTFRSGFLHLDGLSEALYITSPNMTSFGTSMGPRGEHTIMRKISPDSNYGGFGNLIIDHLQNELDYFVTGGMTLKTLKIKLVNAYGEVVNLNGTNWSFSIMLQDLPP